MIGMTISTYDQSDFVFLAISTYDPNDIAFMVTFLSISGFPDPLSLCYILTITLDYISGLPDPRPGQRFPSALLQV